MYLTTMELLQFILFILILAVPAVAPYLIAEYLLRRWLAIDTIKKYRWLFTIFALLPFIAFLIFWLFKSLTHHGLINGEIAFSSFYTAIYIVALFGCYALLIYFPKRNILTKITINTVTLLHIFMTIVLTIILSISIHEYCYPKEHNMPLF